MCPAREVQDKQEDVRMPPAVAAFAEPDVLAGVAVKAYVKRKPGRLPRGWAGMKADRVEFQEYRSRIHCGRRNSLSQDRGWVFVQALDPRRG